jgi:hypothetical protein
MGEDVDPHFQICVCVQIRARHFLYESLSYTYIVVRFSVASASMSAILRALEIGLPIKYAAEVVEEAEDISPG